jgi:class 3 adenylate cyclase
LEEIAEQSGEDPSFVARCEAAGLLESSARSGYPLRDAGRVRLVRLLLRRGIEFEAVVRAEQEQGVLAHFVDDLYPAASWPAIPLEEAARRVSLDIDLVERVWEAAGLGEAGGLANEADVATLQGLAVALASGFPEEALLQMLRVYADALGRVAEAESHLFHFYVHERLRGEGLSGRQLMDTTHAVGEELRALMEPAILYFHGKGLAKSLEQDFVLHAAEESGLLPPPDVTGQLDASLMFVDLASFTSLTESMGDLTATEVLSRFSQLVRRAVNHCDGRVVKQIGDAFMLVFLDATSALRGALEIQQTSPGRTAVPGHAARGALWSGVVPRGRLLRGHRQRGGAHHSRGQPEPDRGDGCSSKLEHATTGHRVRVPGDVQAERSLRGGRAVRVAVRAPAGRRAGNRPGLRHAARPG